MKRKLKCWFGYHSASQHKLRLNIVFHGKVISVPQCRYCDRAYTDVPVRDFTNNTIPKIILSAVVILWAALLIHFIWFTL